MSDANQNNEIVTYLCTHAFQTEALLKAQSVILNSLMKVVCANSPELIEQIKETMRLLACQDRDTRKMVGESQLDIHGKLL